jgi:hypothetical protein
MAPPESIEVEKARENKIRKKNNKKQKGHCSSGGNRTLLSSPLASPVASVLWTVVKRKGCF